MTTESSQPANVRRRRRRSARKAGRQEGALAAVVGSGGNIGSHLVWLLARMPEIGKLLLIDPDFYVEKNIESQNLLPQDVGRPKVVVQAERLSRLRPSLEVVALASAVEDVPLGLLKADVILTCVDSRQARQVVNHAAFRLGACWIDAGVDAKGLLARVNGYLPGQGAPCMECAWDDRDYQALEQTYPCAGEAHGAPPTDAPASLGALAASLQATECRKFLRGENDHFLAGRQVLMDVRHHRYFLTRLPRSPLCRFDHSRWEIDLIRRDPRALRLKDLLGFARRKLGADGETFLTLEEHPFALRWVCTRCGRGMRRLHLLGRLPASRRLCSCGGKLSPTGMDVEEGLALGRGGRGGLLLERTLSGLGFLPGDVLALRNGHGQAHFQVGGTT